jgi:hypothetical protein
VALQDQAFTEMGANEPRTTRHEHLHCNHRSACIAPADLHRIAAAGKYHGEDAPRGTYPSVIFLTTGRIARDC